MESEEQIGKGVKTSHEQAFKSIRSRKTGKDWVSPLNHQELTGAIKGDKDVAEKPNDFLASVFTAEMSWEFLPRD